MSAIDQFSDFHRGQIDPYIDAETVTVSVELQNVSSGIVVDVDCSPTVTLVSGTSITIPKVMAGTVHPCRITHITNFGGATSIISVF